MKWEAIFQAGLKRLTSLEQTTEQKYDEARLREAEVTLQATQEWAHVTLNSISDAVITTDRECRVTYLNRAAETLTGWLSADALGKPLPQILTLVDGQTLRMVTNPARRAMEEKRLIGLNMDGVLIRQDGSQTLIEISATAVFDQDDSIKGAVIVFHDAGHFPLHSSKLAYQAQHDALTNLPNRILLSERLSRAMGLAKRHKHQVALLYLDLDAFKAINDSLGHAIGDLLLQSVAGRLSECVRDTDTICRQGGDEFVVLLSEIEKSQDAARIAEKILNALAEPYPINNHELSVTTSIGISLYPDHGTDEYTLLDNADTAMYHAKKSGRNTYQLFNDEMNALSVQHHHLTSQLKPALKADALFLDFQPRIDIATGDLASAEALVRWRNPTQGLMQPSVFLPVAEACGLIAPIGHWVLGEVCRQLQAWRAEGAEIVPIAVNMSAIELHDKTLPTRVADILSQAGLDAHFLELEVTESSLMHLHTDAAISTLIKLNQLGVRIGIDDFGVGSLSVTHFKRLPISTVNIASCFIHDMLDDQDSAKLTKALIHFGQDLALRVIAKGVETQAQLDHLKLQSCDAAQGFLFSRPLSAADFRALLGADQRSELLH
ncbi:EAL domain-containing protein [Halomonas alkaliantarctica]|nr:EAL domain-containing protein [Halomonas alkaliantarctica]